MNEIEIKFEVNDFDKASYFLSTLGLNKWVIVEKRRLTTKYKDFNICLDDVKMLGQFIEVEIITDEENIILKFNKFIEFQVTA